MSRDIDNVVDYMVMIVDEYAIEHGMSSRDAFQRLDVCGGIEAIEENYDIEHTLPVSSTLDALDALHARHAKASNTRKHRISFPFIRRRPSPS